MKYLIFISAFILLTSCETIEHNRNAMNNQRPLTQKEIDGVLIAARDFLYDPYSVRDAEISTAIVTRGIDGVYTTMACVKFNSKNRMGGYTGKQQYALYLDANGRVWGTNQDWTVPSFCKRMTYRPFVEAEVLKSL